MSKRKRTAAEKREKKRRRAMFETIFVGGKQKGVKRREAQIEGLPVDEFIRRNADPLWLHAHELWECLDPSPDDGQVQEQAGSQGT